MSALRADDIVGAPLLTRCLRAVGGTSQSRATIAQRRNGSKARPTLQRSRTPDDPPIAVPSGVDPPRTATRQRLSWRRDQGERDRGRATYNRTVPVRLLAKRQAFSRRPRGFAFGSFAPVSSDVAMPVQPPRADVRFAAAAQFAPPLPDVRKCANASIGGAKGRSCRQLLRVAGNNGGRRVESLLSLPGRGRRR